MTLLKSKTPQRKNFRRRLLIIALLCLSVSLLLLTLAGTTASREKGLRLGSTSYSLEFDEDDSPAEWIDLHTSHFATSSHWCLALASPFGVLTIGSDYRPSEALRKRLPRDVPSLMKHLASKNRFEVKVAAELLAEKRSEAVVSLPAMFRAWAAHFDSDLYEEIRTISFAAPEQSIDSLIQGLSLTNSTIRVFSTYLLGSFKTNALRASPALWAAFETNKVDKAHFARAYLDITGECSAMMPTLREILKNGDWQEKNITLELLRKAGLEAASALPEVLNLLQAQRQTDLEGAALLALSRISEDKEMVLECALAAINNTETNIEFRSSAIHSLSDLGTLGVPHLYRLYKTEEYRDEAGFALTAVGSAAAPFLDAFRADLHSTDLHRVSLACEIIASLGSNSVPAIPELITLLQSKEGSIRAHSAAALVTLGHVDDSVIEILTDEFAIDGRPPWRPSLTLVNLLITNVHSRAVATNRLRQNPPAARHFNEQIDSGLVELSNGRLGYFDLHPESPEIRDLLRSIATKPE